MVLFILKSSACLAVFMVFYKLFLEKESIHHFKRFYLLGALLVSIVIPFITFTEYTQVESVQEFMPFQPIAFTDAVVKKNTTWQDYIPTVLWSVYALGVMVFSIRFLKNLFQLFKKIKTNPKFKTQNYIHVLLIDLIHPHTFFNYIFLNKNKYEHNRIPKEVLWHEQTHAKQKHALDILCIELLHIIFWFNPLLYYIKKDIKLNHEFLADKAVLKHGVCTKNYQNILLAFSSNASHNQLANAINYSLIKKRFTVMKTQTSKKAFWLKGLLILPILAILIYGFSEREIVEKEVASIEQQKQNLTTKTKLYNYLVEKRLEEIEKVSKSKKKDSTNYKVIQSRINLIRNDIDKLLEANASIESIEKNTKKLLQKINSQQKATPKQITEYNNIVKKLMSQPEAQRIIKLKDVERIKYIYSLMTDEQKKNAEAFPKLAPPPPPPTSNIQHEVVSKTYENASEALLNAKKEFEIKAKTYGKAIKLYKREGRGDLTKLIAMHSEVKKLHSNFSTLAKKEKMIPPPPFPPAPVVKPEKAKEVVPPPPPPMDSISTYNSLAQRTKFIPTNRENNMLRLRLLYDKMSDLKKPKVESPSSIDNYILRLNSLTAKQTKKIYEHLNIINKKAKSEGRRFYSAKEYKKLEKLYSSFLTERN
ncbi:M56 family metallopeptidase [Gelatiniphilus marinus]|uniref:M56 family metallopeptidase n=1 Tax=Gelatiniphilus marinus TaxID=1759464 RepID=A0ABW5JUN2_9FLAO